MAAINKFQQGFRLVTGDALNGLINAIPGGAITLLTTNGAIDPHTSQTYVVTKAGVLADTLAAPTAGTDDGTVIVITSNTANAHTVTATGLLQDGSTTVNVATFAANPGASLTLMAYQGKWNVLSQNAITFS
jgi:microcystin degradation protein MlrC